MIDVGKFLIKREDSPRVLQFVVTGNGSPSSVAWALGEKGKVIFDVPVDGRIEAWLLLGYCGPERNGSAEISIARRAKGSDAFASIVGSAPPKLSNTDMAVDDQLDGWTRDLTGRRYSRVEPRFRQRRCSFCDSAAGIHQGRCLKRFAPGVERGDVPRQGVVLGSGLITGANAI